MGEIESLIALDRRSVTTTGGSALVSIPAARDLGLVDCDDLDAAVAVREDDEEIVVEARIKISSGD